MGAIFDSFVSELRLMNVFCAFLLVIELVGCINSLNGGSVCVFLSCVGVFVKFVLLLFD